jgi:hypothetical protein
MRTFVIVSVIALTTMTSQAQAGNHGCCNQCGCGVKKVCRLKCEMRPATTYRYEAKCEDFCLPGPSKCCGTKWVCDCQSLLGKHKEHIWQPSCGCVRHRKLLVKVPVTKQVPVYTCEVVDLCGRCGCAQVDEAATAEARARQIMPVSAELPLVLEDHTQDLAPGFSPPAAAAPVKEATFVGRIFGQK